MAGPWLRCGTRYLSLRCNCESVRGTTGAGPTLRRLALREAADGTLARGLAAPATMDWLIRACRFPHSPLFQCPAGPWPSPVCGRTSNRALRIWCLPRCLLRRAWRIAGCLAPWIRRSRRAAKAFEASRAEAHGMPSSLPCKAILIRSVSMVSGAARDLPESGDWGSPSNPIRSARSGASNEPAGLGT